MQPILAVTYVPAFGFASVPVSVDSADLAGRRRLLPIEADELARRSGLWTVIANPQVPQKMNHCENLGRGRGRWWAPHLIGKRAKGTPLAL
jgi:hypothetical protein